jgi:hypothetical protein
MPTFVGLCILIAITFVLSRSGGNVVGERGNAVSPNSENVNRVNVEPVGGGESVVSLHYSLIR